MSVEDTLRTLMLLKTELSTMLNSQSSKTAKLKTVVDVHLKYLNLL